MNAKNICILRKRGMMLNEENTKKKYQINYYNIDCIYINNIHKYPKVKRVQTTG